MEVLNNREYLRVSEFRKEILVSSILPKNELENVNFCPSLLGQKFFVCFLGEQKVFGINWPLVYAKKITLNVAELGVFLLEFFAEL